MRNPFSHFLLTVLLTSIAAAADSESTVLPKADPPPTSLDKSAAPTTPAVSETPGTPVTPDKPTGPQKRILIDFGKLSFTPKRDPMDPTIQQPRYADQVPPHIKSYDGKPISITGFMMPLKVKSGKTTEFVLFGNQASCCYGATPQFCDYIFVKVPGEGVQVQKDIPVNLEGIFHVGDVYQKLNQKSFWLQLYTLDCTSLK